MCKFIAERIITCQCTNENLGNSLTKRDFRLQSGNLVYKMRFSFTKRDSWVTNGTLALHFTPDGKVTGLSKLARTVEVYARRPQIQERLTVQIADALERALSPKGIMVMLEAEHTCMTMRGVKKPGSKTITTVTRGAFKEDKELQKMFLSMVGK